jgi:hypothetical protein
MLRSARRDRAALSMRCRAASEAEAEPNGGRDDAFVQTPVERNVVGYLGAEGTCAKSNLRTGKRVVVPEALERARHVLAHHPYAAAIEGLEARRVGWTDRIDRYH